MCATPFLPTIPFAVFYHSTSSNYQLFNALQSYILGVLPAYGLGLLVFSFPRIPKKLAWAALLGLVGLVYQNEYPSYVSAEYFYTSVVIYLVTLVGLAAIVKNPPNILRWFTLLGEASYAIYALHAAFLILFGILGIPLVVISAFVVEFALRPKQILGRLRIAYGGPKVTGAALKESKK